jgi:hypothetical protein
VTVDPVEKQPEESRIEGVHARRVGSAGRAVVESLRLRKWLADLNRFCFFVGYARSGSTLVGAILNAHPEIVIANELDVLAYVERGVERKKIFSLLLQQERDFAATGYQWTGYDYAVPGQYQGTFERLRVIGDKRAGRSTHRLRGNPGLLDLVRRTVKVPIRIVHVVRNPYDNVATMARRRNGDLSGALENYLQLSATVDEVRARLGPDELLDVRYESFVQRPAESIAGLCRFLGVAAPAAYIQACVPLVRPSGSRSRDQISWSASERREIDTLIERRTFLAGYAFDG